LYVLSSNLLLMIWRKQYYCCPNVGAPVFHKKFFELLPYSLRISVCLWLWIYNHSIIKQQKSLRTFINNIISILFKIMYAWVILLPILYNIIYNIIYVTIESLGYHPLLFYFVFYLWFRLKISSTFYFNNL
jgi:hypothetical protein